MPLSTMSSISCAITKKKKQIVLSSPYSYVSTKITTSALSNLRCLYAFKLHVYTYYGPIVNVRRASDNATYDFYADVSGNIGQNFNGTGTTLSSWLTSTTGYVTKWYDQSVQANHMVQTTPAYQPQIILNDAGGICVYLNTPLVGSQLQTINNIFTTSTVVDSHIISKVKSLTYVQTVTINLNPSVSYGSTRFGCHLPWNSGIYYYDAGDSIDGSGRTYSAANIIPANTLTYFSSYKQSSSTSEGFNVNEYKYSSNTNPAATVSYLGVNFSDGGSICSNHYMYSLTIFSKSLYNTADETILLNYLVNEKPLTVFGCILWLDSKDPYNNNTQPTNNTLVYTWSDKSGLKNNGTASAGVNWTSSGLNSLPAFTITNLFAKANFFTGAISNTNSTMTIFVVATMSASSTASGRLIGFSSGDGVHDFNNASFMGFLRQSNTGMGPYRNGVYVSNNPTSYGIPTIWECWYDGTNAYATNNQSGISATITSVASSGAFNFSYFCVGNNPNTGDGNGPMTGYISEIIVYNTCLTTIDRQKIETYLNNKWINNTTEENIGNDVWQTWTTNFRTLETPVVISAYNLGNGHPIKMSSNGKYMVMITNQNAWLYYSSNNGTTFSVITTQIAGSCNASAISCNGQIVTYCNSGGSPSGLWLSTNSGSSFTQISNSGIGLPINVSYYDIQISMTGQYMITVVPGCGYYSTNYGTSWTQIITANGNNMVGISGSGQYMYVFQNTAVYYSTNYGISWSTILPFAIFPAELVSNYNGNILVIASSSTTTNVGGLYVYNNGPTGSYIQYFTGKIILDIAITNDGLIILALVKNANGTSSTLYYSRNVGITWYKSTIDNTQFWHAVSISGNGTQAVVTTYNNGTEYQLICTGFQTAVSISNSNTVYTTIGGTYNTLASSSSLFTYYAISDNGQYIIDITHTRYGTVASGVITWTNINNGNTLRNLLQCAISTSGQYMIFTMNDNVYGDFGYTTNSGSTWIPGGHPARYFACCTNNSGSIMIANGDQGTWVTINSGTAWTNYTTFNAYGATAGYGGLCQGWVVSDNGTYMLRTPYSNSSYFWTSNSGVGNFNTGWVTQGQLGRYDHCSMSSDGKYQVVNGYTPDGNYTQNYISSDYGSTWNQVPNYIVNGDIYLSQLYVTRNGSKLFAKNYVSNDFGTTWCYVPSLLLASTYIFSANANYIFNYDSSSTPYNIQLLSDIYIPYTTSIITIAGYSATPTELKIKWTGGDALTVYSNNTSTMNFTVNGVLLFPVITYDGTNIFAVFSGLTNVDWTVVLTSTVGTLATKSITIPQVPSSLSPGGTQYLNVATASTTGNSGALLSFSTNYAINSSFTRLFQQFTTQYRSYSGFWELCNLVGDIGYQTENGSSGGYFYENSTAFKFDKTTFLDDGGIHTVKMVYTNQTLSVQVDSGTIQTTNFPTILYHGTNYNMTGLHIGANFGWSGTIGFTNILVTN